MSKTVWDFIDTHKGRPALVLGHGPSLGIVHKDIKTHKNDGKVLFGCNKWYDFYDTVPDYWFFASTVYTIKIMKDEINKYSATVFFSNVIDKTPDDFIDKNLRSEVVQYNNIPFTVAGWGIPHVTDHDKLVELAKTMGATRKGKTLVCIQKALCDYTGCDEIYHFGGSVILNAIAASVIMGCNPIYVAGVDMDFTKGESRTAWHYGVKKEPGPGLSPAEAQGAIKGLKMINRCAKKKSVKIIDTFANSKNDAFEKGNVK